MDFFNEQVGVMIVSKNYDSFKKLPGKIQNFK